MKKRKSTNSRTQQKWFRQAESRIWAPKLNTLMKLRRDDEKKQRIRRSQKTKIEGAPSSIDGQDKVIGLEVYNKINFPKSVSDGLWTCSKWGYEERQLIGHNWRGPYEFEISHEWVALWRKFKSFMEENKMKFVNPRVQWMGSEETRPEHQKRTLHAGSLIGSEHIHTHTISWY